MNEKGRQTKLLAAIAILAMVVCVFAVAMPSDDVDAEVITPSDATPVTYTEMQNWTSSTTGNFSLKEKVTLNEKTTLTIPNGVKLYTDSQTLDASAAQLIVNGYLYVNGTNGTLIIGGTEDDNCIFYGKVIVDQNGFVKVGSSAVSSVYIGTGGVAELTSGTIEIVDNEKIGFTATLTEGSDVKFKGGQWHTDVFVIEQNATLTVESDVAWNGTITNNGTITVNAGKTLTNNGAFTNNGTISNNGTFTNGTNATLTNNGAFTNNGTISNNGTFTNTSTGTYNGTMVDGVGYVDGADVKFGAYTYTVYNVNVSINNAGAAEEYYFLLGVNLGTPTYTGKSFDITQLTPRAIVVGSVYTNVTEEDGVYTYASGDKAQTAPALNPIINTSNSVTDATLDTYIDAGTYPLQVEVNMGGDASGTTFNVTAKFTIVPADYKVTLDCGDGWNEGAYTDADAPVVKITDVNGNTVDIEPTIVYISTKDQTTYTDPSKLVAGDYYIKISFTSIDNNYNSYEDTFEKALTVGAFKTLDSNVEFFPIVSEEILGFDPALIQDGIGFSVPVKTTDGYDVTLTGKLIKFADTDGELKTALITAGFTTPGAGYYLAFYVDVPEGKYVDTENMTIVFNGLDYVQLENPDETSNDVYPYYIYYVGAKLPASADTIDGIAESLVVTVDLDGNDKEYYNPTTYTIDLMQLNLYKIVLVDEFNDTLTYYYPEGYEFYLPSGAGQGFSYWATEANSPYASFQTNSIIVISDAYADGDYEIVLTASYGSTPVQPVNPATDVKVYIAFTENGVELMFYGVDGYVPAADISFDLSYTYTVTSGGFIDVFSPVIEDITITNENNSSTVIVPVETPMFEGGVLYSAYATVTIGGQTFNTAVITLVSETA